MNESRRPPAVRRPATAGLLAAFLETAQTVEARLEASVNPLGLSLAKVGVLHHLAQAKEPMPLRALAEHQGCVRSNITQLIDRLEKEGLVRRRSDAADRRSVRAALTPAGERAYARAMRVLADEQRVIVSTLGPGDAAHLQGVLEKLLSDVLH